MATTRQNPASPSRLSCFTFGLGSRSTNASVDRAHEAEQDDPWYIPYNGPVEPPRVPFQRRLERDSWGDPIKRDEEDAANVHKSYEVGNGLRHSFIRDSPVLGDTFHTDRRVRTQSVVSGRTIPSDPSQTSSRRLTMTSPRLPALLPASGGVGESPMPPATHHRTVSKERISISMAGLLSFGGQTRKRTSEPHILPKRYSKTGSDQRSSRSGSAGLRRSSSTGSDSFWGQSMGNGTTKAAGIDDHHYASFHVTNAYQKTRSNVNHESFSYPYNLTSRRQQQLSTLSESGTNTRHPYSYVFPSSPEYNGPQPALLSTDPIASSSTHAVAHTPTSIEPGAFLQNSTGISRQKPLPPSFSNRKEIKGPKNSASTPNLRIASVPHMSSRCPAKVSSTTKIKERLLSAETWCDAILFPRPRLKMKKAGCDNDGERIVSLPPSPVNQSGKSAVPGAFERGVASRVLAHSRTLADFDKVGKDHPVEEPGPSSSTGLRPHTNPPIKRNGWLRRPKSWALDDLALPSPVPSLAQVLEEGEKFQTQRKQWQNQATKSFQNKRTRSISRIRSNSLVHNGCKNDGGRPSHIDFLAAKACLGSQIFSPVVAEHKCESFHVTSSGHRTPTRTSHPHSNTFAMAWSKSSKSHTPSQSRSDSSGRTVFKVAKHVRRDDPDSRDSPNSKLENDLKGDGTRIIHFTDAAGLTPNSTLNPNLPTSPRSPVNDANIGIALTTPSSVDLDAVKAMRLSSHPYAQGGLYSSRPAHSESRERDYGVRDPAVEDLLKKANIKSISSTSGPIVMASHPYSKPSSSRDSYLPDARYTHNDVPAPSRMWAQLSSGIIREVHPDDIQYSPFMSENTHRPENVDDFMQSSRVINDTVGIGEALAFAVSPSTSQDSGLGTSEEHATTDRSHQVSAQATKKSYRPLVQYDTTRSSHLPLQPTDDGSAHTFAPSPLLHQPPSASDMLYHPTPLTQVTHTSALPENLSRRSPRSISDPDDLEGFYDLFYDPNRPTQPLTSHVDYGSASDTPKAESELASLARQLSEELEQMTLEQGDSPSWRSSEEFPSSIARKATVSTLEFVFEETSSPDSEPIGLSPTGQHTFSPFQASSVKIPEDVELSRASSVIEHDKGVTEFHAGIVESASTHSGESRASFIDHMSSLVDRKGYASGQQESFHEQELRKSSGLQPPSADPTRSSSTTSSILSRMSTLSDFPAPPQRHTAECMSLITSYFDEPSSLSELRTSYTMMAPSIRASLDNDIVDHFAEQCGDEEIEELVAALSSHSHSTIRH